MAMCSQPALNARLADLHFGQANDADRAELEAHLLVCDVCWSDFQCLSEAVHVLRADANSIQPVIASDLIQLVGVGARLERPFGGHRAFVGAIATGFGLMVALALVVEVAFQWPSYPWALTVSCALGAGSAVVCAVSFESVRRRIVAGRPNSMWPAVLLLLVWAVAAALAVAPFLSADPIVLANFQTMTARIGWIKSVAQALEIPLLALVPFQFVLVLQKELQADRIDRVLRLLTNHPMRVVPKGAFHVRPVAAGTVFALFATWWIVGSAHLFENLQRAQYFGTFLGFGLTRMTVAIVTLLMVLLWYLRILNELKREAVAISAGRRSLDRR